MRTPNRAVAFLLCLLIVVQTTVARGEAIDDKFTQLSPQGKVGSDERVHGSGYGKILMRIIMFGAVPGQGVHYMPEGTDLLFAIIYAGGYGETTKLNGITIRRRGVKDLIVVDLEDLMEEASSIPKLVDGDVVQVPFNWRKDYQTLLFYTSVFSTLGTLLLAIITLVKVK